MNRRELAKLVVLVVKSVPCGDCGVEYPPYVMDFDHIVNKKMNIADAVNRWSIARLIREMHKCEVVCANCHRVRTHERRVYRMEAVLDRKLTKQEVVDRLKARIKKDGTPFAKPTGPRKRKLVTSQGLQALLGAPGLTDESKVAVVKSFGPDGRAALRELRDASPADESLANLFKVAFPGAGTGRPYQDEIKATTDGKAVVSGFEDNEVIKIERNEDGSVTLRPTGEIREPKKAEEKAAA